MMKSKWWNIFRSKEQPVKKGGYFDTVVNSGSNFTGGNNIVRSESTAMKIATVWRCVDILSGSIASLPLTLSRRKSNGYLYPDTDNPIYYLLNVMSNSRLTSYELIKSAVVQMLIQGNAFMLPRYDDSYDLESIVLLAPYSTTYDVQNNTYLISDAINNIFGTYEADEVIHLKNLSLDGGFNGVSTLTYASTVMSIAASADNHSLQSFDSGYTQRGFISGKSDVTKGFGQVQDKQLDTVTDRVREEIKSGERIFKISGDMSFTPLSMSPADIQLLETKKFSVLDICRFFGVHPDKVFAGQSQNYKASDNAQTQFNSDTLLPYLRKIEAELFAKLISRSVAGKYKLEFDLKSYYKMDLSSMSNYMEKTIHNGVFTINAWRKDLGLPPIDGGDEAMISNQVTPISKIFEKETQDFGKL